MSADYTTIGLIANAKRRGFNPTGSGLTTSDFLQILSEQLRNYIPAFLKSLREEYIVAELTIAVTSRIIPVPVRACGSALRTIGWTRADGSVKPLDRIEPERRGDWANASGEPQAFMFQGNNVILFPVSATGSLVVSYQQRPGQLVLPTSCALLATSAGATAWNATGIPTTVKAGAVCDIVSHVPNFKLLAMDVVVDTVSAGVITFTSTLPTDIVAGDYVCVANETPIPQIPIEAHDLLAQAGAMEIAQSTGSTRLPAIAQGLKDLRDQVSMILSPRADGSSRPIVNRSRLGSRRW